MRRVDKETPMPDPSIREYRIRTLTGLTREPVQETKVAELIRAGRLGPADEAQRIGSQRWRTMQELAPHLFRQAAAAEMDLSASEPAIELFPDTPTPVSATKAPRTNSDTGGAMPKVGGFTAFAWIFIALAALELLPWLNAMFVVSKLKVQNNMTGNWLPIGTIVPVPPNLMLGMTVHAVFGSLFVIFQPFLILSAIPGALMTVKLLRFLPEGERPFRVSGVWWRWMLWIGSPVAALFLLRITAPTNTVIPTLIGAASSAVLVLFALLLVKIAQRLREEVESRTGSRLLPLGIIAGWTIVATASVRALLYVYMGYGMYMIESGSAPSGPGAEDFGWLKSLVDIAQVAAIGLMVAWTVELAIRLPKLGAESRKAN